MRIGLAGKGGAGKTTIAATLARLLARQGYGVTALDDDPNPNLGVALGLTSAQLGQLRRVPRDEILAERTDPDGHRSLHLTRPFEAVLAEYGVCGPDDVGVLMMTGLLGAGKGWLCSQHAAVRGVMGELPARQATSVIILDMEASIEHISRGTVRNVDALLVVTEPYYRSLETTGRMVPLARDLGLEQVWIVANKVRSARDEAAIREYCARRDFDIIGAVPFDERVIEADHVGSALLDYAPRAAAVAAVSQLADTLLERLAPASSAARD